MSFYSNYYYDRDGLLAADGPSFFTQQEAIQRANELNDQKVKPQRAYRPQYNTFWGLRPISPVPDGYWVPMYSGPYSSDSPEPDPVYSHPVMAGFEGDHHDHSTHH